MTNVQGRPTTKRRERKADPDGNASPVVVRSWDIFSGFDRSGILGQQWL